LVIAMSPTPTAVIGLGAMGLPMAARLAETMPTRGYDVASDRLAAAEIAGVERAPSPAEAASGCEVVVLSLRTLSQVREAIFGDAGIAASLAADTVVVLTSTVGIDGARDVGAELAERGIHLLDLPVSGGPGRARSGDLLALTGGNAHATTLAHPIVERLASTIVVVGPNPGDGQALKTVNQLLCGVHIAAAAEALALAAALGLDVDLALSALNAGAAASFMLDHRGPRIIEALRGDEPEVLSRVDIFVKDMGIVAQAGHDAGVALPVAGAADQLYRMALAAGLGAQDDSTIARLLRSTAG
jgi:3-hydroxyisobutyrate dehydrogenase